MLQGQPLFVSVNLFRGYQLGLIDLEAVAAIFNRREEAGAIALVTSGADLLNLDQERISIAIQRDLFYALSMSTGLAFHQELLPGTAPEVRVSRLAGFFHERAVIP